MMINKEVISIFVDNQANVLSRIVSFFGRRGFNIDSLTVSTTNNPEISRITIVCHVDEQELRQIITQTEKLEIVREIFVLDKEESLYRELLLMKIRVDKTKRSGVIEIANIYRAKVIDLKKDSMILELTGAPDKIDNFMEILNCYDIVEVCRTGATGISRGLNGKTQESYENIA